MWTCKPETWRLQSLNIPLLPEAFGLQFLNVSVLAETLRLEFPSVSVLLETLGLQFLSVSVLPETLGFQFLSVSVLPETLRFLFQNVSELQKAGMGVLNQPKRHHIISEDCDRCIRELRIFRNVVPVEECHDIIIKTVITVFSHFCV